MLDLLFNCFQVPILAKVKLKQDQKAHKQQEDSPSPKKRKVGPPRGHDISFFLALTKWYSFLLSLGAVKSSLLAKALSFPNLYIESTASVMKQCAVCTLYTNPCLMFLYYCV